MMVELKDRRILVTGGAGGIGAATARRLAAAGARVIVADMSEEPGQALVAELGTAHLFIRLDVTDPAAWAAATDKIRLEWGGLDIAFLNAGVMSRPSGEPILDDVWKWLRPQDLEKNLAVNLRGAVYGTLAVAPILEREATVLITASAAGLDINPLDPFYGVSKAAAIGFVRSMAPVLERQGIRIAAICPVGVETAMTPADLRERAAIEGKRRATPEDLAEAVEMVLDKAVSGDAWVAGVPGLAYRHDFPPLRDFNLEGRGKAE